MNEKPGALMRRSHDRVLHSFIKYLSNPSGRQANISKPRMKADGYKELISKMVNAFNSFQCGTFKAPEARRDLAPGGALAQPGVGVPPIDLRWRTFCPFAKSVTAQTRLVLEMSSSCTRPDLNSERKVVSLSPCWRPCAAGRDTYAKYPRRLKIGQKDEEI